MKRGPSPPKLVFILLFARGGNWNQSSIFAIDLPANSTAECILLATCLYKLNREATAELVGTEPLSPNSSSFSSVIEPVLVKFLAKRFKTRISWIAHLVILDQPRGQCSIFWRSVLENTSYYSCFLSICSCSKIGAPTQVILKHSRSAATSHVALSGAPRPWHLLHYPKLLKRDKNTTPCSLSPRVGPSFLCRWRLPLSDTHP